MRRTSLALVILTLFASVLGVSVLPAAANTPICNSASSDSDGDGWGWEHNGSCRVVQQSAGNSSADGSLQPPQNFRVESRLSGSQVGLAWDAVDGAAGYALYMDGRVVAETTNTFFVVVATSVPINVLAYDASKTEWSASPFLSITDELGSTALLGSVRYCQSAETDTDGDGWGFEGGQSCLVPAPDVAAAEPSVLGPMPTMPGTGLFDPNNDRLGSVTSADRTDAQIQHMLDVQEDAINMAMLGAFLSSEPDDDEGTFGTGSHPGETDGDTEGTFGTGSHPGETDGIGNNGASSAEGNDNDGAFGTGSHPGETDGIGNNGESSAEGNDNDGAFGSGGHPGETDGVGNNGESSNGGGNDGPGSDGLGGGFGSGGHPGEQKIEASHDPNGRPYCLSASSDSDGDGWGFENNTSCVVR